MTRAEAIKMLTAKAECMKRDISGFDEDCNSHRCSECNLCYEQGNMGEQVEYLQMAIKALEEQQWIPCSVKYPEADERVLVTRGGYDYYVWDCMSNRGDDYFWEDEEGFYHNKYEVRAWMPLPEPYKKNA